jgi:hypothetical protein
LRVPPVCQISAERQYVGVLRNLTEENLQRRFGAFAAKMNVADGGNANDTGFLGHDRNSVPDPIACGDARHTRGSRRPL